MVQLHANKLRIAAEFARFCNLNQSTPSDVLWRQMLGIAIRKLHDHGSSRLGTGKYLGHPYWSCRAVELLRENGMTPKGITSLLSHEHVVPISLQVKRLLSMPRDASLSDYETEISNFSIVAILTREEDAILRRVKNTDAPEENWVEVDPWWRYRAAGLYNQIVDYTDPENLARLG